jgi:hypothetical protein
MNEFNGPNIDDYAAASLRLAYPNMNEIFLRNRIFLLPKAVKVKLAQLLDGNDRIPIQQYYDTLLHKNPSILPNFNRRNDAIRSMLKWHRGSDSI